MDKKNPDHMDNWLFPEDQEYPTYTGTATESVQVGSMSWDFGDLGSLTDSEEELREKYPALKQAWEHYNNVKKLCEAKEKENED